MINRMKDTLKGDLLEATREKENIIIKIRGKNQKIVHLYEKIEIFEGIDRLFERVEKIEQYSMSENFAYIEYIDKILGKYTILEIEY